ncbi:cell division protein [Chromobacterium phragmitis]|uniref:Peptidoglycan D,D-transpeptidase FtsI n=1 Tax=Chromobacterium phragmitis TaxID=2202141 RepID=A0A344UD15_9NEIS|nr:cell division protein [Chromobacterium phragmitis]
MPVRHRQLHPHPVGTKMSPIRTRIVTELLCLCLLALLIRAAFLQLFQQDFLQKQGDIRFLRALTLEASRGRIVDRNGQLLASSSPVKSLWANPEIMQPLGISQLRDLAELLDVSPEALNRKLIASSREFVYLKRRLDPRIAQDILDMRIPGIFAETEFMRFYPSGESTAHVIGLTGSEGKGQEGIELSQDGQLTGRNGSRQVLKDLRGQIIADASRAIPPTHGKTVELALDARIQYQAHKAISSAVQAHKARSGSVIVLDAKNGELLAAANYPAFNPNNRQSAAPEDMRNRGIVDAFEAGSVMKPFAMALALEDGHATLHTMLDTRSYKIGPATVRDVAPRASLDMLGIMQKSSNVGTSKLALMSTPERFWRFYNDLGFGRKPGTGFPGESSGTLRDWKTWRQIDQATMSFGYGVSGSLLQLARAFTVFANGGLLLPVSLYPQTMEAPSRRVVSERTAALMRDLLVANSQAGGGAAAARVPGYSMGGKPGTARKLADGRYVADKHRASFIGFAPGKSPRIIVAVTVDEPSAGQYYGGAVAAPIFSRVAGDALRLLNIQPDAPGQPILPPMPQDIPADI